MAGNNTARDKYTQAKPFDIIRTIQNMQKALKTIQIQSPGLMGPWQSITSLGGSFGFQVDGYLVWRTGASKLDLVGYHIDPPGSPTSGAAIVAAGTLPVPTSPKEFAAATDVAGAVTGGNPRVFYTGAGALEVFGLPASGAGSDFSFIMMGIPLDI